MEQIEKYLTKSSTQNIVQGTPGIYKSCSLKEYV